MTHLAGEGVKSRLSLVIHVHSTYIYTQQNNNRAISHSLAQWAHVKCIASLAWGVTSMLAI